MSGMSKEIRKRQEALLHGSAKSIYFSLLETGPATGAKVDHAAFIAAQLKETSTHTTTIPNDLEQLDTWLTEHHQEVGRQYQEYLQARKSGQPRRYFSSRSHALYFIKAVAPTKMVDGSWLYGLMRYWQDPRLASLIKIYLEELGNGVEAMNHVVLYRKLLKVNECDDWKSLDDKFFTQGAVQLALASNTNTHLPEVIGFNLGYEQLPLHLLITAYELKELNIDPYYFTLHTTIDNAQTGHARSAIEAVKEAMPAFGNTKEYMDRIIAGVKLNDAGLSTLDIIEQFDLQAEVVRILQSKAAAGRFMHSNRCLISGKTINEWLMHDDQIADFLHEMETSGWIKRHENPEESPFWKTFSGDKAPMFGVFTAYEQQVLYDWIAGDALETLPMLARLGRPWRMVEKQIFPQDVIPASEHGNVYDLRTGLRITQLPISNDLNQEQLSFERYVGSFAHHEKRMDFLVDWLSPAKHHTALGLSATRYFKSYIDSPFQS
jgi:hypothetical protein